MKRIVVFLLMGMPAVCRSEFFIDVYGGKSRAQSGSFTASEISYIGTPYEGTLTFEGDFGGSQSRMGGLRCGYWDKNIYWLGGAADINHFKAESQNSNAEVSLTSFSLMLMLRYPLLINDDYPNGRFYSYITLSFVEQKALNPMKPNYRQPLLTRDYR